MNQNIEIEFPAIRLIRQDELAACEIPALLPGRRAWLAVYPLFPYDDLKHEGDYRLRVFEVDECHLINDNDVWEGTMHNRADEYLFGEDKLLQRVRAFTDPKKMGTTQKCDYPV